MVRSVTESTTAQQEAMLRQAVPGEASPHRVSSVAAPAESTEVNEGPIERVIAGALGAGLAGWGVSLLARERTAGRIVGGLAACGAAAPLLWWSATGHCSVYEALHIRGDDATATSHPLSRHVHVVDSIAIARPRQEVYERWKALGDITDHMRYLRRVEWLEEGRSRWTAIGPGGRRLSWIAETTEERSGELIVWCSTPDSEMETEGRVSFEDLPAGRGTLVSVRFTYQPTGGAVGAAVAKASGVEAGQQVREELRRFKSLLEAGEVPSNAGQPSGRC